MKTTDLIPFILLELNDSDKYGFELTKNIETKSNGGIVIKQPTLYTLLKKLEKSKFIDSYWQDSDIGGKRHYYKLTENGKLHVSTLPSYSTLLSNVLDSDFSEDIVKNLPSQAKPMEDYAKTETIHEPIETIIPSEEVFASNSLTSHTNLEINLSNAEILKSDNVINDEQFASNADVMKFTEKTSIQTPNFMLDLSSSKDNNALDQTFTAVDTGFEVPYVDYQDLRSNPNYTTSKKIVKAELWKSLATSGCLVLLLLICDFITHYNGHSALYYIVFISSLLYAIFYPILTALNTSKRRLKYQTNQPRHMYKRRIIIGSSALLTLLVVGVVASILQGNKTIISMLSIDNFANIYAPIILASSYFIDLLFNKLIVSKKLK